MNDAICSMGSDGLGNRLADGLPALAPSTPGQRALWQQLTDPAAPIGSQRHSVCIDLYGELRGEALQAAFRDLLDRHDALSASFVQQGTLIQFGGPAVVLQSVVLQFGPDAAAETCVVDDSVADGRAVAGREVDDLERATHDWLQRRFDVAHGPLLQACVWRVDQGRHRLCLAIHGLICDAGSLRLMAVEWGALYGERAGTGRPPLAPPGSFADHAWRCAAVPRSAADQQRWCNDLTGLAGRPLLTPANDGSRSSADCARRRIDAVSAAGLDVLAQRLGASRRSVWWAAIAVLIALRCRRHELLVAIESDAPAHPGTVGFCRALRPVLLVLDAECSFAEMARRAHRQMEDLLQRAAPDIDLLRQRLPLPVHARWPYAPVLLRWREHPVAAVRFPGLRASCSWSDAQEYGFEHVWTLHAGESVDWIDCQIGAGSFDFVAGDWLAGLDALLQAALREPELPLSTLAEQQAWEWLGVDAAEPHRWAPLMPEQSEPWQRRLHSPDWPPNNCAGLHRLSGAIDSNALRLAMQQMLQRQAGPCVQIGPDRLGQLGQHVEDADLLFKRIDAALLVPDNLSAVPASERENALQQRIRSCIEAPFDLQEPLFRPRLFRLSEDQHWLLLVADSSILDQRSLALCGFELAELYAAAEERRPPQLPALNGHIVACSQARADGLCSGHYASLQQRWRSRTSTWPALPQLPEQWPIEEGQRPCSVVLDFQLPDWLIDSLRGLACRHGCSLRDVLFGASAILLARSAGVAAAVIGVPMVAADDLPPGLMGPFTQIVPVRIECASADTFGKVIEASARALAESADYAGLQQRDLGLPVEQAAGRPLPHYQMLLCHCDLREQPRRWGELSHAAIGVLPAGDFDPFGLWLIEDHESSVGGLRFDCRRFDRASAWATRDQLLSLLAAIAERPEQTVGELHRPPAHELDRLLAWGVGADAAELGKGSLAERIGRHARQRPQAPAIIAGGRSYSFRYVSQAVTHAVRQLRGRIAEGDVLALACPAGIHRLVALLAGLRIGAHSLLLDPARPTAHLRACLSAVAEMDARGHGGGGRRWLLAEPSLGNALNWPIARRIERLRLRGRGGRQQSEDFAATDTAGLLFPVQRADGRIALDGVSQHLLLSLSAGLAEHAVFSTGSRVAVMARPDAPRCLVETLLPLLAGAAVVFAPQFAGLADAVASDQINTVVADPDDCHRLFTAGWRGREGLSLIGDGMPRGPVWAGQAPVLGRYLRAFGAPGAGIWSLLASGQGPAQVLPGRQIEVLDDDSRPCAIGAFGCLQLTAHAGSGAIQVARPGRARWRADGHLEAEPVACRPIDAGAFRGTTYPGVFA